MGRTSDAVLVLAGLTSDAKRLSLAQRLHLVVGDQDIQDIQGASNVHFAYVDACMSCLENVSLTCESTDDDQLELRALSTIIEIVIAWGVRPLLDPCLRNALPKGKSSDSSFSLATINDGRARFLNLVSRLSALSLSASSSPVSKLLLSRHLLALYAAHLDLDSDHDLTQIYERAESVESLIAIMQLLTVVSVGAEKDARRMAWRKRCGELLSGILLRKNGVRSFLSVMLPTISQGSGGASLQLNHISRLIMTQPAQSPSKHAYFSVICPQLIQCILTPSPAMTSPTAQRATQDLSELATHVAARFISAHPLRVGRKYVINPIIGPITTGMEKKLKDHHDVIVEEADLSRVVIAVHGLLKSSVPNPEFPLHRVIEPVIPVMYYIHQFAKSSSSQIRSPLSELLKQFFKAPDTVSRLCALTKMCIDLPGSAMLSDTQATDLSTESRVLFVGIPQITQSGGVHIRSTESMELNLDNEALVSVLKDAKDPALVGSLMMSALELYVSLKESERPDQNIRAAMAGQLLLTIIGSFSEDEITLPSFEQTLRFIGIMLSPSYTVSLTGEDSATEVADTITMSLGLLSFVIQKRVSEVEPKADETENVALFRELSASIQRLESQHSSPTIREMASSVHTALRSAIPSLDRQHITLIPPPAQTSSAQNSPKTPEKVFASSLVDLDDDCAPVRAHAMAEIRKLVEKRDAVVVDRITEVLDKLTLQMQERDSYVFLNAIKCLAAIADTFPGPAMRHIVNKYRSQTTSTTLEPSDSITETRLRYGETLQRILRRLGTAFAKYAEEILPTLLVVLHDGDASARTSALSLLATVAQTATWALLPYFYQLLDYLTHIFLVEKDTELRKSAAHFLLLFVQGVNERQEVAPETLPRDWTDMNVRLLRLLEHVESDFREDDMVRAFAKAALDECGPVLLSE
ncbi:armadillo-type protein [Cladochytrium replicatum]|nr:armadillo-type protein [Cladochytrium replicatum]